MEIFLLYSGVGVVALAIVGAVVAGVIFGKQRAHRSNISSFPGGRTTVYYDGSRPVRTVTLDQGFNDPIRSNTQGFNSPDRTIAPVVPVTRAPVIPATKKPNRGFRRAEAVSMSESSFSAAGSPTQAPKPLSFKKRQE